MLGLILQQGGISKENECIERDCQCLTALIVHVQLFQELLEKNIKKYNTLKASILWKSFTIFINCVINNNDAAKDPVLWVAQLYSESVDNKLTQTYWHQTPLYVTSAFI